VSTVLAFETSCDETAVAILKDGRLLASEVASQIAEHEKFGGVVPEVASRNHLQHAQGLLDRTLSVAGFRLEDIDAFAATSGPGLATSLMIGASLAKGLAIGLNRPYLAVNHLEGHLLSPFFGETRIEPNVALVVSGGHTMTVLVREVMDYEIIGRTVDDAAGEAFDKVAKMLGFPYPGGPEIEKAAASGNAMRFDLPRSMRGSPNFSFSGLKTSVRYLLPTLEGDYRADLSASFQKAVIDVLVEKTVAAARQKGVRMVTVSGGVSCNRALREAMRSACAEGRLDFRSAEPNLCTDNAGMIAYVAALHLARGAVTEVTNEIDPNLTLA
jgi:N6-L-threonylcarbamoyladenine synthase